jgi:quercetin 2,3-dioxygenase
VDGVSNTVDDPAVWRCASVAGAGPVREVLAGRTVRLGESTRVRRLLPTLGRRMVGAWCFVDHYGPDDVEREPGMAVPTHPHIGLQTVSWLLDGEVHHRDSLGSDVTVRPGELALMTAGGGIAHSEYSPARHGPVLHGAQLWVALPGPDRGTAPRFEHHTAIPVVQEPGLRATVLLGEVAGARSPGRVHSPLVGLDVALDPGAAARLPLEPDFEHAVLTVSGAPQVDGGELPVGSLCYLGTGRREITLGAGPTSRLLVLGGLPFGEEIVMWWNFVGRSGEEIAQARAGWEAMRTGGEGDRRFAAVPGDDVPALAAPALPAGRLRPRGPVR